MTYLKRKRNESVKKLWGGENHFCLGSLLSSIRGQKLRSGRNELKFDTRKCETMKKTKIVMTHAPNVAHVACALVKNNRK